MNVEPVVEATKRCRECSKTAGTDVLKPVSEFPLRRAICKNCYRAARQIINAKYYRKHREIVARNRRVETSDSESSETESSTVIERAAEPPSDDEDSADELPDDPPLRPMGQVVLRMDDELRASQNAILDQNATNMNLLRGLNENQESLHQILTEMVRVMRIQHSTPILRS